MPDGVVKRREECGRARGRVRRTGHLHGDDGDGGGERGGEPSDGLEVRAEGEELRDAEPEHGGDEVPADECAGLRERRLDGTVAEDGGRALFAETQSVRLGADSGGAGTYVGGYHGWYASINEISGVAEDGLENTESGERANERPEPDDIIRPLRWYCCAIAYPASEPRGITGKRVIRMWVH